VARPDVPHNHGPVLNDPPQGRERHTGEGAAFVFGWVLVVVGGLAVLLENSNHSACSSVFVQAGSQGLCAEDGDIWTLGAIGIVVGVALLIVGAILRSKSS
jgi:hypothetical protein